MTTTLWGAAKLIICWFAVIALIALAMRKPAASHDLDTHEGRLAWITEADCEGLKNPPYETPDLTAVEFSEMVSAGIRRSQELRCKER